MTFKDHFSQHAESYAEARPLYPAALFAYLSDLCGSHQLAWDCATGNGQAARGLAPHFDKVIATDASQAQLDHTTVVDNIDYRQCSAEQPVLDTGSADLITVAQALHWFDTERFFANAGRILKPEGILAVWIYGQFEVDSAVEQVVAKLYEDVLGEFWPEERRLVERFYDDIEFPFVQLATPEFHMSLLWSLQQLTNYLMSWSATQRYIKHHGNNPLDLVSDELALAWGSEQQREILWPLTVKVCKT